MGLGLCDVFGEIPTRCKCRKEIKAYHTFAGSMIVKPWK